MRILAISDVRKWEGYEGLVDKHKPDVVALAGDLTSDGGAAFWHETYEHIAGFRRVRDAAFKRKGITVSNRDGMRFIEGGTLDDVNAIEERFKKRYRGSPSYTRARRKLHTERFYDFLVYAGRRARVLVVKGDHDDDFPKEYSASRINRIRGCQEISGIVVTVDGTTFLGLGYDQAGYRRPLRQLVEGYTGAADVVIAHPPHENVRLVAALKPRLLIRGHFGYGRYLVEGVPTVFTSGEHALIELEAAGIPRIQMARTTAEASFRQQWNWLGKYPL